MDREIGRGGAARVFLAQDKDGRRVALKVLHPELAVSVAVDRFLQEIRLLEKLSHPHIARLLDSGEKDYIIYYVMAYVEGPTLHHHIGRVRKASVSDSVRIAHDLLGALAFAHQHHIVHRDVKPENIILSAGGPVLLDFGIARAVAASGTDRLTRSGFSVGSSNYMSPEQVQGAEDIDARSDIYSMGCVLYECLAGRPPFSARRDEAVLQMHLAGKLPDIREHRDNISEGLVQVIEKALSRDRSDRWDSARVMQDALLAATQG